MCVALMYTRVNEGDDQLDNACDAYLDIAADGGTTPVEWSVKYLRIEGDKIFTTNFKT